MEVALNKMSDDNAKESVYVDMDCKLQLKTKCGKNVGFSSKEEFFSLLSRLSGSDCANVIVTMLID